MTRVSHLKKLRAYVLMNCLGQEIGGKTADRSFPDDNSGVIWLLQAQGVQH